MNVNMKYIIKKHTCEDSPESALSLLFIMCSQQSACIGDEHKMLYHPSAVCKLSFFCRHWVCAHIKNSTDKMHRE